MVKDGFAGHDSVPEDTRDAAVAAKLICLVVRLLPATLTVMPVLQNLEMSGQRSECYQTPRESHTTGRTSSPFTHMAIPLTLPAIELCARQAQLTLTSARQWMAYIFVDAGSMPTDVL